MTATNAAGVLTVWASPADTSSWNSMREIHLRIAAQLDIDLAAECGIDRTTFDILNRITRTATAPRLHDLLDTLPLSYPALSSIVDRLTTRGLVAARPDPEGSQATRLTLTEAGAAVLARATPVHAQAIASHLPAHLTMERFARLSIAIHI